MDKNNDIQINKADESLWQVKNSLDSFVYNYNQMLSMEAMGAVQDIYEALNDALDRFNELENKCKTKDDALQKMIREVTELEKEKIDLDDRLVHQKSEELKNIQILEKKWKDKIERLNAYITILKKERDELKTSMTDSNQKAYAMGWVDGRNGNPPVVKEIITPKEAIIALDGMYLTISQLIQVHHDIKDECKAAALKLNEIRTMIMSLSERYGVQPWEKKELEDIIKYINDTNKEKK